jgi:eukaryotic-like serine/threonine-protein kinase
MEIGAKLTRYEIREKIGAGGMGEVYLAHDEQLDRMVALKVLLPEFCCHLDRVQRFKLEARAASALNHPNIITIYEIGETDHRVFIATEFIDGETLREKIEKRELTLLDSIKIAEQVADALAVAHEAHIVHRDIKPENIMIRRDGYVKILDFGLAKSVVQPKSGAEDKTLQLVQTQAGMVMGSVRYMSPEQARGKEIDQRSDIWSMGVVLYEMVSGQNPFDGETVSDSLAAIIHVEPPPPEDAPDELEEIIFKALRKRAEERYQNIRDLAQDLKDLRLRIEQNSAENRIYQSKPFAKTAAFPRQDTSENKTLLQRTRSLENSTGEHQNKTRVLTAPHRRSLTFLPLVIVGLAALIAWGAWYFQPFAPPKPVTLFESMQISRITESGRAGVAAVSSDGKYIAYINNEGGLRSLMVRQVATGSSVQVAPPTNLNFTPPTFSNDGNYVFYTAIDKAVGTLYQVPSLGGSPKKIIVDVDSKISFSPDGSRFVFIRHNPDKNSDAIIMANTDGANPQAFITTDEVGLKNFSEVAWSPKGDKLLAATIDRTFNNKLVSSKLITISLADKKVEQFGDQTWLNANSLSWLKDANGIFMLAKKNEEDQQQIWFVSYPEAQSRQITNDSNGYVWMSYAAENNSIAALKSDIISSLWSINPQTKEIAQITSESRDMLGTNGINHLPGGKLVVTRTEGNQINLWTIDENGKNETQLTKDSGINVQPFVAPDGRYIVFSSNRTGEFRLWRMDADGKNPVQLTNSPEGFDVRPNILPDNKTIIFERRLEDRMKSKLMKTTIDGGQEAALFPESQTNDAFPSVSKDGKLLAYTAQSFDAKNLIFNSALKISGIQDESFLPKQDFNSDLGLNYKWAADNKSLVFINRQGVPNLFVAPMDGSAPKPLTNFNSGVIFNFDLSPDGKRIFFVRGIINADLILIRDTGKTN